jgi:hypothetical protein
MMFTNAEYIETYLIGQFYFFEKIVEALAGADRLPGGSVS